MIIIYLVLVEAEQQGGWRMERMLPLPVTPSILTLPALLDGDFPSSILLVALLPPEPDDDRSESYMLHVPRSQNVFRIYICCYAPF